MNKNRQNKALAAVLATSILVTGTFAWQSFSQLATNETITEGGTAGGRLHDYFNGANSDSVSDKVQQVFVENYANDADNPNNITSNIFARVRLSEYLEYGYGAGILDEEIGDNEGDNQFVAADRDDANMEIVRGDKSVIDAGQTPNINDKSTWDVYLYNSEAVAGEESIRTYRDLTFGGETVYMPTFNQVNDTTDLGLKSDVMGTLAGSDDDRHSGENTAYDDYESWTNGDTDTQNLSYLDEDGVTVLTKEVTHTADTTLPSTIMTMEDWLKAPKKGNFWVYDVDGWAYWANPIVGQSATGLLLNGMTEVKNAEGTKTYYAVHAEAQFATAGDWGDKESTDLDEQGMYANNELSTEGEFLLNLVSSDTELFSQPTTKLTTVTELTTSEIQAMVGTEETITVDGVEYYVLDRQSLDTYYTDDVAYKTTDSVLLFTADAVDIADEYQSTHATYGLASHQVIFDSGKSTVWSTSDMRLKVLPSWLETASDASQMVMYAQVETDGFYDGSDYKLESNGGRELEITYDKAYLISQPEVYKYGITEDKRIQFEKVNSYPGDITYSGTRYAWTRSAIDNQRLRVMYSNTSTMGGDWHCYAGLQYATLSTFAVRPVLWVAL